MSGRGRQQARSFRGEVRTTVELRYLLYLPRDYQAAGGRRWPLALFLHGRGEQGTDLELVKRHGLPRLLESRHDFPAIVVSPQCLPGEWWSPPALHALLDEIEAHHAVDPDRVYVTGLSMGGFGTWALAIDRPDRFAAIAPICGGGEPIGAWRLVNLPVWAFHGDADEIVPLRRSEEMIAALRRHGGAPRFTVYPGVAHDSWTRTYDNPALYEWLFAQRRA